MSDNNSIPPHSELKHSYLWRSIRVLNLYQILLSLTLYLISYNWPDYLSLTDNNQGLFSKIALIYFSLALIGSLLIANRKPDFNIQVIILSLTDIIALSMLLHLHGGSETGFGILLIVAIASVSIIAQRTTAINLAALAVIAILGEQIYSHLNGQQVSPIEYLHAGTTGIGIFAAALITNFLSQRLRFSEILAEQRRQHLIQIQQLTEYVLQRMQTGVVVLDEQCNMTMINQSALTLLNLQATSLDKNLSQVSPNLYESFLKHKNSKDFSPLPFKTSNFSPAIIPRFVSLKKSTSTSPGSTLIFLEDISATKQKAQQMKLLSLGKLSANIAHEVRNPLGAIAHATQLLSESDQLATADQRLLNIIMEQTSRMNAIIEGVLQLSRGDTAPPVLFPLSDIILKFKDTFVLQNNLNSDDIRVEISPQNTKVRINPGHFEQILWNLCGNALRYTQPNEDNIKILLKGGVSKSLPGPYLDIIDYGEGITSEELEHIFEPFFTTSQEGSGLGLYISMELCEANQARVEYIDNPNQGACFRILFADPRRKQLS